MDKRLLSHDPITGLYTYHNYNPLTDETTISYEADSSPIIEANKKLQNDPEYSKAGIKQEFWHYAHIPVMVQMDWLINHGVDITKPEDAKKCFSLVNDPNYKHLKMTTKVHVPKH